MKGTEGLPRWCGGKESAWQWRGCRFNLWVRKITWNRKWQPTPVSLLRKFHGQRSLVGCGPWDRKEQLSLHAHSCTWKDSKTGSKTKTTLMKGERQIDLGKHYCFIDFSINRIVSFAHTVSNLFGRLRQTYVKQWWHRRVQWWPPQYLLLHQTSKTDHWSCHLGGNSWTFLLNSLA